VVHGDDERVVVRRQREQMRAQRRLRREVERFVGRGARAFDNAAWRVDSGWPDKSISGSATGPTGPTNCRGSPFGALNVVRSSSWRLTISSRHRDSTARSSAPSNRRPKQT
jgi:hypothetical protein